MRRVSDVLPLKRNKPQMDKPRIKTQFGGIITQRFEAYASRKVELVG
jgi:hypothetical protein